MSVRGTWLSLSTATCRGSHPADVRAGGRDNGWVVGVRGRLNKDLRAAYLVAREVETSST